MGWTAQYTRTLKKMSKPTTKRQASAAKGIHKVVTTFVDTKSPKKRKR